MQYKVVFYFLLLACFVVEAILQARWNRTYVKTGIPLFIREKATSPARQPPPDIERINEMVQNIVSPRMLLRTVGETEQAFREKLFAARSRSSPIMRGLIVYNYYEGKVVVKGYMYWSVAAFIVCWYAFLIYFRVMGSNLPKIWLFVAAPVVLFGIMYLVQISKFKKILDIASELWAEKD